MSTSTPATLDGLIPLLNDLWQPGHFFVSAGTRLAWQFEAEHEIAWEIHRGRLLDANQTRQSQRFLAWNLFVAENGQPVSDPLLSLLVEPESLTIHVTRGILCHVWLPHANGNVIEAAETTRWIRELVGSVSITDSPSAEALRDEIVELVRLAIVGLSRLPLNSLEAPLPAFSLGNLTYAYRGNLEPTAASVPMRYWPELLNHAWPLPMSLAQRAKLLEAILRAAAPDDIPALASLLSDETQLPSLLRRLFNDISLSPYTDFIDKTLAFVRALVEQKTWSAAEEIDFLCHLLRQQSRHLNAYDLVLFHHRGANYPDALLLDAVLRRLLTVLETDEMPFADIMRRRALRQACLARRLYEGHAVPSQPTSPGENARVLPWERVAEEEILEPSKRRRHLFADSPLSSLLSPRAREILRRGFADLEEAKERTELGTALFIDRPLGFGKHAADRDQTALVAHLCVSPSLIARRLIECERLARDLDLPFPTLGPSQQMNDIPVASLAGDPRPIASLADANKVAGDFVVVRTMPGGLRALFACFHWPDGEPARWPSDMNRCRLLSFPGPADRQLTLLADDGRRWRIELDMFEGWAHRAGVEFPRAGLIVSDGDCDCRARVISSFASSPSRP